MLKSKSIKWRYLASIACLLLLAACTGALQRGMLGNAYISTARPSIMLEAKNMPLMLAGRGICNMPWTGMMGGLNIDVWLAVYGTGGLAPMAIAAQAQAPQGWYWDGIMRHFLSVNVNVEQFNGQNYQACTYIINPADDPFGDLATGVKPDGQPQLWLARTFMARCNFDQDKIILQYREPLPDGITSLEALPYGQSDVLAKFDERARNAFIVGPAPANPTGVKAGFANAIRWQLMDQNFLGSVSKYDNLNLNL